MEQARQPLTDLQQSIVSTIAYFDLFEYPLTLVEVQRFLYRTNASLSAVYHELSREPLTGIISSDAGFYFLAGRQQLIATRLERYRYAEKKYQRALRAASVLCGVGFVDLIAVCNNVGISNGTKRSDIDFFIVVRHGHLWWTRLVVTGLVTLIGLRRHGRMIENRICLSFYITDQHFDLHDIALRPQDPYLLYWLASLAPIFDRDFIYQQFLAANQGTLEQLPNFYPTVLSARRRSTLSRFSRVFRRLEETVLATPVGRGIELVAKKIQLAKMSHNTTSAAKKIDTTEVVISDTMLKFHETDRRVLYRDTWQRSCSALIDTV